MVGHHRHSILGLGKIDYDYQKKKQYYIINSSKALTCCIFLTVEYERYRLGLCLDLS